LKRDLAAVKKTLLIIIFTIFAYNLLIFFIDHKIEKKYTKNTYDNCRKIWSSRGLYKTYHQQNSIKSFQNAFSNGFIGVEVDFYYDKKKEQFIISHNKPKKDKNGNLHYTLKDGKILTLEELLHKQGEGHYFWLDYKNLDRLSIEETQLAIKRLNKITKDEIGLKDRLYIEGSTPNTLEIYTNAGFKTLFAFQPLKEDSIFSSISSNIYKIAYYFYNITAVALPYGPIENPKYSKQTQENLKGIPTFLFHVPDEEALLEELVKKDDVRVMLIGRDKSINRSNINNCSKEN
jgi:glycerophosphoryl diester phosphodiesterase